MRLRDELWFKGRDWFQERLGAIPQDDALIAELTAPTYTFTSTGKMVVESKADMKKRGMRSPDLADTRMTMHEPRDNRSPICGVPRLTRSRRWTLRRLANAAASRENCARLRDELWFKGREWFQDRACSMPKDDALIAELTSLWRSLKLRCDV